jgi:hypothetical protein
MVKCGLQERGYHSRRDPEREIRKIPVNQKLTLTLESGKKVSNSKCVFSENGNPYGNIKTGGSQHSKRPRLKGLDFTTSVIPWG